MAGVDVGYGSARRVNADVNMVPFIDLLMVTISFLLITAVWVSHERIPAGVHLPGPGTERAAQENLHVHLSAGEVTLVWKLEGVVVRETRFGAFSGSPADTRRLGQAIEAEWRVHGRHVEPTDRGFDEAVLHFADDVPYATIVSLMDAASQPKRQVRWRGADHMERALSVSLATNSPK